jgi:hypothetical protein
MRVCILLAFTTSCSQIRCVGVELDFYPTHLRKNPRFMSPRHPIFLASLLGPSLQAHGQVPAQNYDTSYQLYQEDDDRIRIESYYIRGSVELSEATSVRVQWLSDAISGASPTGAMPLDDPLNGYQPDYAYIEDVRTGILGGLSQQIGEHRLEVELSRSEENDYLSRGLAISDTLELNQKNTTVSFGVNYLNDNVIVPVLGDRTKQSYDLFTGVSQIFDKNTVMSANLTLGNSQGYLNDQYKYIQRNEIETIPDGLGGTIDVPVVNIYRENRPDNRFRQVLQLEARHYFSPASGALDGVLRISNDDYGVFSQTLQLEWRQEAGDHFQVIPFFRYYRQNAANFFVNTLNNLPIATPSADPNGSGLNYSADYRLSAFDAVSGGLRLRYQFNDIITASASYERYVMSGQGGAADRAPEQAYASADIWTVGLSATF